MNLNSYSLGELIECRESDYDLSNQIVIDWLEDDCYPKHNDNNIHWLISEVEDEIKGRVLDMMNNNI